MHFQNLSPLLGLEIIVHNVACVSNEWKQIRFPKSKKKRIRKKWRKKRYNFGIVEVHKCIRYGDKIMVSERDYEKIKLLILNGM